MICHHNLLLWDVDCTIYICNVSGQELKATWRSSSSVDLLNAGKWFWQINGLTFSLLSLNRNKYCKCWLVMTKAEDGVTVSLKECEQTEIPSETHVAVTNLQPFDRFSAWTLLVEDEFFLVAESGDQDEAPRVGLVSQSSTLNHLVSF